MASKRDTQDLRSRAEARHHSRQRTGKPAEPPQGDLRHELEVHQIELEMQDDELQRTQARLELALARYQDLFDLAPLGYVTLRPDGRILKANLTVANMLGIPRLALTDARLIRYASPGHQDALSRHLQRVFAGLGAETCELELTRGDGSHVFVRLESTVQSVGDDLEPECLTAISDITEQQRREDALRKTQEQLRLFVEQAPISIAMLDREMRYLATSRRWVDEYGRGHKNLVGLSHYEVHPDLLERWKQVDRDALAGAFLKSDEDLWIQQDGSKHWLRWAVHPWTDDAGEIGGIIISVENITERKQAEEKLRQQLRLINAIADCAANAIFVTDSDGRVTFLNSEAERVFGYSEDELRGRVLHDVIHHHRPDGRPYPFEDCPNCFIYGRGERVRNQETVFFHKDGSPLAVACSNSALEVGGEVEGAVLVAHDISEVKRAEQALREADRRKDEFLATLAHELRNPLAPICNAVEVLKRKDPPDTAVQTARDIIDRQSRHMVRLIDDLLDVSRVTQGRLELRRERIGLEAVLEQAVEASRPHLERGQHQLDLSLPSPPITLDADPVRLTQVFVNLLNNACKYTSPGGRIALSAERDGTEAVVTVTDTGRGIAPEYLPHLFEMFARVESDFEQLHGGVGIGLWLARGLVEMHGGSIAAHSEGPGRGSTFRVRLPALAAEVEPVQGAVPGSVPACTRRRILVVDDNRDIVDSMVMLLEVNGHEVATAYDGLEAIEVAARYHPEVILLDIGMPKLDGYATCRRIRQEPWGKDTLIVALTGWGQSEDRRKSAEVGFDGHLVKPADPDDLIRLLDEYPG